MDEAAAVVIRKKKNSSISVGLNLVKEDKADVFISAGNNGAVVAAADYQVEAAPER
jgi:glycerol-3-phosphate acyltransferase PlsX